MTGRRRSRLPGRTGTVPAAASLGLLVLAVLVFGYSPTLNPQDLLAGRFFDVEVPRVTELTQTRALVTLQAAELEGEVRFATSARTPRGKVVSQAPPATETARRGSSVRLVVSLGPARLLLPDFVGASAERASGVLRDAEVASKVERRNDEAVPEGSVISQSPAPGTLVLGGSTVALVVSLGPVTRAVPEVTGLAREAAAFRLGQAGFLLGDVTETESPAIPRGGVIRSDPPAGSVVAKDTRVDLEVSSGPPPASVPKVTGQQQTAAAAALGRAGFLVGEITQIGEVADPLDGVVLGQTPAPGTQLRAGSVVTLTVRRAAKPPPTTAPTTVPPAPPSTAAGGP